MLGLDEVKQLVVEGEDVAADLRGVELAVLAGQGCLDLLADVRAGHDALIRGLRGVVFLGHASSKSTTSGYGKPSPKPSANAAVTATRRPDNELPR